MARGDQLPTDAIVMRMLVAAANNGDPCPSNAEITTALDLGSMSCGSEVLTRLEKRGLIAIERGQSSRVVTILETGKRTAGKVAAPHWRYRPENLHRRNIRYRSSKPPVDNPPPPPPRARVNRDPCTFCGVRADIGCSHQVRWA